MKLIGVMLGSDNPKVLGNFYTKIFGKPDWQQDDWYGFMIGDGNLMVGPHSEVKGKNDTPGRIMTTIDCEDVKKEFDRMKELGATVVAQPYQPGKDKKAEVWLATLADPDGNYFQLATPWKS